MLRYEMKKMLDRTGGRVAVLLLAAITVLSCWLSVTGVEWVNEQGQTESGVAAAKKLREAAAPWAGELDTQLLKRVLEENRRINATPQAKAQDVTQQDIAYSWKQGFSPILSLLNCHFSPGFRKYDYNTCNSLSPDAVGSFYENRIKLLTAWLNDEGKDQFTQQEKAFLISQYEATQTPYRIAYMEGWLQLQKWFPMVTMLCAVVMGYLVSGIFANEFKWKADAIYFSALHGRKKATTAKVGAGIAVVSAGYWCCVGVYTLVSLTCVGFEGALCPVQADFTGWKCLYNVNNLQRWLLCAGLGYLGNLFFALLTIWISARTRSAVFAVMLPFLLLFLPSFLGNIRLDALQKLLGLLPDRLLQISEAMLYMEVYTLPWGIAGAVHLLPVLYTLLTAALAPLCRAEFGRKQIC